MTIVTGSGFALSLWGAFQGTFSVLSYSPTGFTTTTGVTVTGTDLTYSATDLPNGVTLVTATGGTITGVTLNSIFPFSPGQQTYSGLNVSAVAASSALANGDQAGFNNLFFGGDDSFSWSGVPSATISGFGGNDVFNISNWGDGSSFGAFGIDGGSGSDTLNITGGITGTVEPPIYENDPSFNVANVENIHLGAGYNYTIIAPDYLVAAGSTLTIDASALGPANQFVFNTDTTSGTTFSGNLVLIGGAGDDTFQGGSGSNTFIGNGGNDTVSFATGRSFTGVTVSLAVTGPQSIGGARGGTVTLSGIENLVGTRGDDTLTGDAGDNILTGLGGNDILNGGAGYDTAVFSGPMSSYTIIHSGATTTVGNTTLTGVELAQFDDQTIQISGPIIATDAKRLTANQSVALSSLFSANDLNGAAITQYQLWDGTSDPNSGYFTINGVRQSAQTVITLSAAQLAQTALVAGTINDALQIRAFDGTSWSAADNGSWAPFTVGPTVNHNPVLTAIPPGFQPHRQTLSLSSLFSVSDTDGDPITRYQLWDGTSDPNSGHFVVNGVSQAAGTIIDISAAQLTNTSFVTGLVSDHLEIRASDGRGWSAADNASWSPFTVNVAEAYPFVTTANLTKAAGQTLAASSLFSVVDNDGDPIVRYQFWDGTRDPNSGYFTLNGVRQDAGTLIDIAGSQIGQLAFVTGSVADTLQVRASDGVGWSKADNDSWSPFTIGPPVDHAPVVATSDRTAPSSSSTLLQNLFQVSDADGDAMTKYELWENTRDPHAGYFTVNGTRQAAGTVIDVTAAQLAQTSFVMGTVAASLEIRAFDGQLWSAPDNAAWSPFTVSVPVAPADHAPSVQTSNQTLVVGQIVPLSSLISVSDPDGDPVTEYQLWDSNTDPNSGYFMIDGVAQPAHTAIDITAGQLPLTNFVVGHVGDSLQIRASDGTLWSAADNAAWSPLTVTVNTNRPPVVTYAHNTFVLLGHAYAAPLSYFWTVSDPDGDTITQYQLWDSTRNPNSGHFVVNGVAQPAGTIITITAAQFAQTSFLTGAIGDSIQMRAFDGKDWSAGDNDSWTPVQIADPGNNPPVVTTSDVNATAGQVFALSDLFSVFDADGDTMTKYQLWDSTADPSSGHFMVNGQSQSAGTLIEITAAQLSQTSFVAGASGHGDLLQFRAFDGFAWSAADNAAWAPFHVSV